MSYRFSWILLLFITITSCTKDEKEIGPDPGLSDYEIKVIDYFKDIALGFEFGNASEITRKWNSEMRIYIGGKSNPGLLNELKKIRSEINELAKDGFKMTVVEDSLQSNYYLFFGTGLEYAQLFPSQSDLVDANWGLFSVFWDSQNYLTRGRMYVDIARADSIEQKHLLREELTQSLGLAKDSPQYQESIFQSTWTTTNEFADIDRDLIRLLYHPDMEVGLNRIQVDTVLREILTGE